MGFTDHCDLFASIHEEGINRIIGHIQRQRPSLFNYATAYVAAHPNLLCKEIMPHPIVSLRGNPLVTVVDPLPIPGTSYAVNFAAQIAEAQIDFHPGDEFALPPELGPPLKTQRLAIKVTVCGGIGCPPKDFVDDLVPPPKSLGREKEQADESPPIPLPTKRLNCFCLSAFVVGGLRIVSYDGQPYLEPFVDGLRSWTSSLRALRTAWSAKWAC